MGHFSIVNLLLQEEMGTAWKEDRDKQGWTPLFYAVKGGNDTIVELLLEAGFEVNAKDEN
jgi:ankyrin repeat protein